MLLALILITIALFDLKYHRIPNLLVVALICIKCIQGAAVFNLRFLLISSLFVIAFATLSQCGFGDVKLLLVICNLFIGQHLILEYVKYLLLIAVLQIMIHLLRHRTIKGDIAFAPALCGAVLAVIPLRAI